MRRWALSGRQVMAGVCAVLSVLALAAGAILLYLRVELLDEDGFADRTVEAVRDPQVRATHADRIVGAAIDAEPDLHILARAGRCERRRGLPVSLIAWTTTTAVASWPPPLR